jgi:tetratricopeptide (TPR) repeat protein
MQADTGIAGDFYQLYQEGLELLAGGQMEAAIERLKASIRALPHFRTYETLGGALLGQGRADEAAHYLLHAVELGRRQARPRYLLARALAQLGDRWAAMEHLVGALALQPDFSRAAELLAELRRGALPPTGSAA